MTVRRTAGRSSDTYSATAAPCLSYTDHAGHFGQWLTKKEERADTIISRELGVVAPQNALDAHRPLPRGIDLEALFAETETRKVTTHPAPPRSGWPGVESTHPGVAP